MRGARACDTSPASTGCGPSRSWPCSRSTTGGCSGGFLGVSTFFTLSGFLITRLLLAESARRGPHLAAQLLHAADPPAAPRRAGRASSSRPRSPRDPRSADIARVPDGRPRGARERRQLALPLVGPRVRRPVRGTVDAPALLVAQRRGAVLSRARAGDRRRPRAGARSTGRHRRGARAARRGCRSSTVGSRSAHSVDRAYYGTDTRALEFLAGAVLAVVMAAAHVPAATRRASIAIAGPVALVALGVGDDAGAGDRQRALPRRSARVRGRRLRAAARGVRAGSDPVAVLVGADARSSVASATASTCTTGRSSCGSRPRAPASSRSRSPACASRRRSRSPRPRTCSSSNRSEKAVASCPGGRWVVAPTAVATVMLASLAVGALAPEPAVVFAPAGSPASVSGRGRAPRSRPRRSLPDRRRRRRPPRSQPVHRVLVVGDSVALTLGRGIERWGAKHGVYVWNAGALGCTLVDGVPVRGYWGVADPAGRLVPHSRAASGGDQEI